MSGDPVKDFLNHDSRMERRREEWEMERPVCNCCDEHIIDDKAVLIGGDYYCLECIEKMTVRF